jgi:pimeloyl-ACP methyl ester carboxylesterase
VVRTLRKIGSGLGGVVDGAVLTALRFRFLRGSGKKEAADEALSASGGEHDRRALLQSAIDYYAQPSVRADFFQTPAPIDPTRKVRGKLDDDGEIVDLGWPSGFQPHWEAVRPDYLRWEDNRRSRVRAYLHPRPPKTALICLHGYQGGSFFIEERAFQARWLYSLGLDVLLFTLPFHGVRAKNGGPSWPGPNPVRTNEGFAHAIYDLRALVAWLRSRPGAEDQRMAVVGMSLGGTTTSLFGTTDALDFIAPMIPVASWPELLWSHGEGQADRARAEKDGITLPLLQQAMSIAAPLERKPMLAPERVLVLSSMGDRIAPPEHAERLAKHFGGVHVTLPGGHVLQLGRRAAFSAIAQRMALLDLIPRR